MGLHIIIIIAMCGWEMSSVGDVSQTVKQISQEAILKPLPRMINIDRRIDALKDVTEVMHRAVDQRERGMLAICDGPSYQVFSLEFIVQPQIIMAVL